MKYDILYNKINKLDDNLQSAFQNADFSKVYSDLNELQDLTTKLFDKEFSIHLQISSINWDIKNAMWLYNLVKDDKNACGIIKDDRDSISKSVHKLTKYLCIYINSLTIFNEA
ncbi:hypothetical protein DY037_05565 [Apilactobacillus micheneri]|uniref:hypothetical protein n=1 Tax=Apilactobacillus micheneri TaxID=1899430 RepID=UPI001125FF27|nr:hypothetical protein [Apilactobacillus micheneri]TPR49249.1 hypothetical protein DY037_05565 [Apilactobacillus micheneri]